MLLGAFAIPRLARRSTRRRCHAAPFRRRQTIWKMVVLQSELLSCVMRRRVKARVFATDSPKRHPSRAVRHRCDLCRFATNDGINAFARLRPQPWSVCAG